MHEITNNKPEMLSVVQQNYLRLEALDLFDRGLTEGNTTLIVNFIEKQLSYNPPRVTLLLDIAEDLHQRLFSLREYQFDIRAKMVNVFQSAYQVDVTAFMPADALHTYHLVQPMVVVDYVLQQGISLDSDEREILEHTLQASQEAAEHLQHDIFLTEKLHSMIQDWLTAFSATFVRTQWHEGRLSVGYQPDNLIH